MTMARVGTSASISRIRFSIRNLIEPWTEACAGKGGGGIWQEQVTGTRHLVEFPVTYPVP